MKIDKLSPAAKRMRNFRKRQKRGVAMTVPVQVYAKEIDLMVKHGLLRASQKADRTAVIEAIEGIMDDWSERANATSDEKNDDE